jgi:hypothetical protein
VPLVVRAKFQGLDNLRRHAAVVTAVGIADDGAQGLYGRPARPPSGSGFREPDPLKSAVSVGDKIEQSADDCKPLDLSGPHLLDDRRIVIAAAGAVHAPLHGPFAQRAFCSRPQRVRAERTAEPGVEILRAQKYRHAIVIGRHPFGCARDDHGAEQNFFLRRRIDPAIPEPGEIRRSSMKSRPHGNDVIASPSRVNRSESLSRPWRAKR